MHMFLRNQIVAPIDGKADETESNKFVTIIRKVFVVNLTIRLLVTYVKKKKTLAEV